MKLLVLAGLPGTGKSTLARELARRTGAPVLDKDRARADAFGAQAVACTRAQDDAVVRALLERAAGLARECPAALAILDGRCWTRRSDVEGLVDFAHEHALELVWVECVCAGALARERIERDRAAGAHPAPNRDAALHERLEREAEPLAVARLRLETDREPVAELAARVLRALDLDGPGEPGLRQPA